MYGKPAMISFKYQMYLYGSEAVTYLNALLWVATEPAVSVIWLPPPSHNQPSLPLYGSITFTHLEGKIYFSSPLSHQT